MEKYQPINISTKINFDTERHALDEGRVNRPHFSDNELDEGQLKLAHHFSEEYSKQNNNISKKINELQEDEKIGLNVGIELSYENFISNFKVDIATEKAKEEYKFSSLSEKKFEYERDLNYFKKINKIQRAADYPTSKIYHYSIVIAIVLAESFANAYFFAQGNDLGLLGGWFQACLISLANVGSALLIGAGFFPFINHINIYKKILSIFVVLIFSAVSFGFNLAAAHYRDLLEKSLNPLTHSIESILEDPFGISFNGVMLLIVGIVAAILAFIKGYTSDDPYPNYGNLDRKYNQTNEKFGEFRSEEINKIRDIANEIISKYKTKVSEGKKEIKHLKKSLGKGNEALQDYANKVKTINEKLNEFLRQYREANSSVRTDPQPTYFSEDPPKFDISTDGFNETINLINNKIMDLTNAIEILESRSNEFIQAVLDILTEEIKNMETRFRKLYREAEKNVTSRNQ